MWAQVHGQVSTALLLGAVLLCAGMPATAELSGPDRALLERAMVLNGVPDALEIQAKEIRRRSETDARYATMPQEDRERLIAVMTSAFDPVTLQDEIARKVEAGFDRAKFEAFVRAYSTPLARKMAALSLATATAEGKAGLEGFARELQKSPPDAERLGLLLELDDLTQSSAIAAEVTVDVMSRMSGISRDDPQYGRLVEQARVRMRNTIVVTRLYALRGASVEDIREYVLLHADPPVAEVSQIIDRATMVGIQLAMRRLMQGLMELQPGDAQLPAPGPAR